MTVLPKNEKKHHLGNTPIYLTLVTNDDTNKKDWDFRLFGQERCYITPALFITVDSAAEDVFDFIGDVVESMANCDLVIKLLYSQNIAIESLG